MPEQFTVVPPARPHPIREYARTAVAGVERDQVTGVLVWRIAEYLVQQLRDLNGRPTQRLDDVKPNERSWALERATAVLALADSIHGDAPPTPGEIRRYEQRKALSLARARARCLANRLNHQLDVFRPGDPGRELAVCRRCGAGVTLDITTAAISPSTQIGAPCDAAR